YLSYGLWLTQALVAAYWFSFFWSASAATYLILRKSVDHTELDEMDSIESPIEQSLPDIPATPPSSSESEIAAGESAEPVDAPESSGQSEQVEGGAS
ncbi:MAG: hypothetical protein KDA62_23550, partial [Planctomycetales bacterium]|nr:hypothetical protein [Planctomycetales bacterium]